MFFPFLFAHLVADFILQPSKLIQWKFKSWKGVAVHAAVHFIMYLLIFLPFLSQWRVWVAFGGVALSHFLVDCWKVRHELHDHRYAQSFVTDQLLHFFFLALGAWLIGQPAWQTGGDPLQDYYISPIVWVGLSSVLGASFVVEVFLYQFARQKTNATFKPNYVALLVRGAVVGAVCVIVAALK